MLLEGYLIREIAERLDLNPSSLAAYTREHQMPRNTDPSRRKKRLTACERSHDLVVAMAAEGATFEAIASAVGTSHHRVSQYVAQHSIARPAWRIATGSHPMSRNTSGHLNAAWRGGRMFDKDGYVLLWMPEHPEANRHGQVREHRIVMEKMLGRPLTREEVVDHRNDIRDDNRPENLRLFATNAEHLSVTLTGRKSRASRGLPPSNRKRSTRGDLP